jgi:hypothetical protein
VLAEELSFEVGATAVPRVYWHACPAAATNHVSQHKVLGRVPDTQLRQTHFEFQPLFGCCNQEKCSLSVRCETRLHL